MLLARSLFFPIGLVALAPAQQPLAEGVSTFIGASSTAAWFEKGGTIWVTDGTAHGTRDTGVPIGSYADVTDRLIVYRPARVDVIAADGSSTSLMPPISFTGFDPDAVDPTVWRSVVSTQESEVIEVWVWAQGGWMRCTSGVRTRPSQWIQERLARHGRFLIVYDETSGTNYTTAVRDLLPSPGPRHSWYLADIDTHTTRRANWSEGVVYDRTSHELRDGIVWIPDRGEPDGDWYRFPQRWSPYTWQLLELNDGFPFLQSLRVPELFVFLDQPFANIAPFPRPLGQLNAMVWLGSNSTILAGVSGAAGDQLLWLDRTTGTWSPVSGAGAPTAIEHLGGSYLALTEAGRVSVVSFDDTAKAVSPIATRLTGVGEQALAFAGNALFAADDGVHGTELWFGNSLLADLQGGAAGSNPREFVSLAEHVVFTADGVGGQQLWSIDPMQLDWRRNPTTGRFYRRVGPLSWSEAERAARDLGGALATIRNQQEHDWLWSEFGRANLWIGLHDLDRDGVFEWLSGERLNYTSWCPGEPNRANAAETAVHIAHYPGFCEGGWNDQDPADRYFAVVERAAPPQPVEPFGQGCSTVLGEPTGAARWLGGWPRPGGTVQLGLVLGTAFDLSGGLILGFDSTRFGGVELPLDLSLFHAPGCSLLVAVDDMVMLGQVFYETRPSLTLPNTASLLGTTFFVQGIGIVCCPYIHAMTNGLRITVTR